MKELPPSENKFHQGNGEDGKHYWLTPPDLMRDLQAEYKFDFDACPYPKPENFDGLTCDWGQSTYANIPFGSIIHEGKKKGPTAWMRAPPGVNGSNHTGIESRNGRPNPSRESHRPLGASLLRPRGKNKAASK